MTDLAFDPVTRITAGELRATGLELPEAIPDCAHVARRAIAWRPDPSTLRFNGSHLTIGFTATFIEPFEWVVLDVLVTRQDNPGSTPPPRTP